MDTYKNGKIYKIEKEKGLGYIADENEIYLFTLNDTNCDYNELEVGMLVRFRAEKKDIVNRAFFIKKLDLKLKNNQNDN